LVDLSGFNLMPRRAKVWRGMMDQSFTSYRFSFFGFAVFSSFLMLHVVSVLKEAKTAAVFARARRPVLSFNLEWSFSRL
jgi:hypothetical protein